MAHSIQVFARLRPSGVGALAEEGPRTASKRQAPMTASKAVYSVLNLQEGRPGAPAQVVFETESGAHQPKAFPVDGVFGPGHSQAHVWATIGEPVCKSVLAGHNSTVLAYGHTGSGKTYSILGPTDMRSSGSSWSFSELSMEGQQARSSSSSIGFLPRAVHALLEEIYQAGMSEASAESDGYAAPACYSLQFACCEVYRNQLLDLCAGVGDDNKPSSQSGVRAVVVGTAGANARQPGLDQLEWVSIPLYDGSSANRRETSAAAASPAASVLHKLVSGPMAYVVRLYWRQRYRGHSCA